MGSESRSAFVPLFSGLLVRLAPKGTVVLREMNPSDAPADLSVLYPQEVERMGRAVDKRKREFVAGRTLARHALAELGIHHAPIRQGEDRAPMWPAGVVGSITHTHGHCAVAVGRHGELEVIGLDVERASPLKPAVLDAIAAPEDHAWLQHHSLEERLRLGKIVFSAKECAYKAQYLRTRQYLGFDAMWIAIDEQAGRWTATFRVDSGDVYTAGDTLQGAFVAAQGLVATMTLGD